MAHNPGNKWNRNYWPTSETPTTNSSGIAAAILIPLFVVAFLVIFLCCISNRRWMKCGIDFLHSWYDCCFFRLDCASKLDLRTAIYRYWENPPLSQEALIKDASDNPYITKILLHLAHELPDFFFSFLPTGSLREGCGKLLPSTAILATDYDMMLVPDGVTVGGRDDTKAAVNIRNLPTFITTENEMIPSGYVWLSLDYLDLKHWKELTIPRFVESSVGYYLSVVKLKQLLSQKIESIVFTELNRGAKSPEVTTNGPAVTVKIKRNITSCESLTICCCQCCNGKENEMTLFYCDFTIGIHHPTWPAKAANWFCQERRKYWPPEEVIDRIKDRGCHLVPKASIKGTLLKYKAAQPTLTTYDHAPSLEWRYSFSQPELELFDCMPEAAKQAYVALKAVNKAHLKGRLESDKNLGYELKSITMRFVEQQVPGYWMGNDAGDIFRKLLDELHGVLASGICPHYWIDKHNLLKDFSGQRLTELATKVEKIQKNPRRYVADNWLEVTRCLRFHCLYCGPRSAKIQISHLLPVRSDPCCMIPCSYRDNEMRSCCPCPYDDINFDVY